MWISKLELINFKSYRHQIFEFPAPENGKNIVLIGGMNGYGKTSILEALYLCLYGSGAIVHLARAGLSVDEKKGYPTFLTNGFNGEAKRDGTDIMSVRVVISKTKNKAFDICRKWYFRNGSYIHEQETVVREITRGIPGAPRLDNTNNFHLNDLLEELLVPEHIAPFFFFDGEEVKKLADQSRVEQVKQGLEGLLGVVLLRNLADRLKSFEGVHRNSIVSVDENRLNSLTHQLEAGEKQLALSVERMSLNEQEKKKLRSEQNSLLERITASGGGNGDIATVKELVEEREQNRNKLREIYKSLEQTLSDRLPFYLVPKDLVGKYINQLYAETKWFTWNAQKQALKPRKAEFQSAYECQVAPQIEPALSEAQEIAIKSRFDAAWDALFYPPPTDCANDIIHNYLHENERMDALNYMQSLSLGKKEIDDLLNERRIISQREEELGRKISKVEGIDKDGTLKKLKKELDDIQGRIDLISDQERLDERSKAVLEANLSNIRADHNRDQARLLESSPARALIEKSERVRRIIDEVIPTLFPIKAKELGKAMTDVYKNLAHKNQVDKILIEEDGTAKILSKNGMEINFDRSAGENQIFATALIAGLAKVSGVKAPMVVDTPLGRLDSDHRDNILKFWVSNTTRQVILLSQDEEIDYGFLKKIEPNVSKTYLLEHHDVGDGIGRTTAIENQYFSRRR